MLKTVWLVAVLTSCAGTGQKDGPADPAPDERDSALPDTDPPADDTATPTDDTATPTDDTATPTDDTATPTDDTATPTDDTATPPDDTATPTDDTATPTDDTGEPPPLVAPDIDGEHEAGHSRPTWLWSWEHEATALQWRIDDGPWWTGDPFSDRVRAPVPLSEGDHVVSLMVATEDGYWSAPGTFLTTINLYERDGYWTGIARDLTTSPLGHALGIVAHNCYEEDAGSPDENLIETLDMLIAADEDSADLLELDIRFTDGEWVVAHDDWWWGTSDAARLADVVADAAVKSMDQPLFIEVKERDPSMADTAALLNILVSEGYAVSGRPVIFRAFADERMENLVFLRSLLDSEEYVFTAPYVRLHVLLDSDTATSTSGFQILIDEADYAGYHGIEFNWTTPDLFNLIEFTKSIGLGTAMWTVPDLMGEAWCAAMREDIDALVVDYDLGDCHFVAEEDTSLIYLNTSTLGSSVDVDWYGEDEEPMLTTLGASDLPVTISSAYGEGLFGSALLFDADLENHFPFYDADNDIDAGFLLATTVEFDVLDLADGETVAIFSKADAGGFALELRGGFWSTKLRFGVHIDGDYHYADRSVSDLDPHQSHFIIAVYDGAGRVRLWVNNDDGGVDESSVMSGGVTHNDVPVLLGADPEGLTDTRFHFSGRIQMAMLQKWRDH
jgi:glycerophosphoryl diester phosphodiesterase